MASIRNAHGQRRIVWGALLMVALVAVVVAGLRTGLLALPFGNPSISSPHVLTCTGDDCALGQGVRGVQLFVEPRDGATPITNAILGATRSVCVEVYLLTDSRVMDALAEDAQRGVDVRVLLEAHPFGGDVASPQRTIDTLALSGIQAKFANPAYTYTHAKMLIIDNATLYVLTANLSRSGLGGSSLARNREFGVVDTHTDDVAEALAIFQADWNRTRPALHDGNMVVSPFNARAKIMALLALARTSLVIEDEEMYDPAAETALIAAAHRGVRVRLVLPDPSMIAASDAARLKSGGVRVEYVSAPYIHAKVIVADGRLAFVGSENFSPTSLDQNREVGLLLADTSALATIAATFERDWVVGQPA